MTSPEAEAAVTAIRRMWADRSAAERSAFTSALTPPPVGATDLDDQIARVRVRAALSGAVDPAALADPVVLEALAPECDRSYLDGRWQWTLRSDHRRTVLHMLAGSPERLAAGLADVRTLPTDVAGRYLRALAARTLPATALALSPSSPVPSPAGRPALPARLLLQALAWAEPLGGLAGDLAEARRRVRVEAVAASYGALLGNGFFGRDDELARLRDFATTPVPPDGRPVPLLPVVGLGGAGKSTALAAFVEPYLRELRRPGITGPVVIMIDFDRVQFRIDAELELSFEVSRQLGNAHPVAAADFSALRHQAREERAGSDAARYPGALAAGEGSGDASAFARDASVLVRMHGLDDRPVLLVLDTFEEWQRDRPDPGRPRAGGNDPEARILRWIVRLRDTMGLRGLRVILSGRADVTIDSTAVTDRVEVAEPVRLADLAPPAAAELLAAHGVPEGQALALAELVGGNPLTLRVAARFLAHLPAGEREDFLAGHAGPLRDLDGDLRRELLYARFLGHIPDPRVRRLAHPGLVLRRVTPGLIRHVLAPHCGLGPLTDAGAADLFARLADEVWLVKRDGDVIRHLPDVRRAMLHLMTTDPADAATLAAIHDEARRWYLAERDLTGEEAQAEAVYHRLMAVPAESGPAETEFLRIPVGRLIALGESVSDLAPSMAVQVRVLRGEIVPGSQAIGLPDWLWPVWMEERGRDLVGADAAAEALDLVDARPTAVEPGWLAQACSDLGKWDDYLRRCGDFVSAARYSPHRYEVVAAVVSDVDRPPRLVRPSLGRIGARSVVESSDILDRAFYELLLWNPRDLGRWRAENAELAEYALDVTDLGRNSRDRFPVDEYRRALAWAALGCPGGSMYLYNNPTRFTRAYVRRNPRRLWELRGDNPELRSAVRSCLAEAGDAGAPDAAALARLDRVGALEDYLDEAVMRRPELARVRDAFYRWDRANNAVIEAIIRDAEAGWPEG